jgi:glyoxylase-like metal-dependent hydrolase (beta-lactamase superfamily II)
MQTELPSAIRLGSLSIDRVEEFSGPVLAADAFLVGLPADAIAQNLGWLAPDHVDAETELMVMADHTWVVRTPDATVLIDTCWGNDKDRPGFGAQLKTNWLEALRALGVELAAVDYVICTHLHADHVGWNTRLVDGEWVPTFPDARYVVPRLEYEYWEHSGVADFGHDKAFADSVLPIATAGLLDLAEPGDTVAGCLTLESAPGHCPGQVAVRAESEGQVGVFAADTIHVAAQLAFPDVSTIACVDPDVACVTRRALLDECADKGHLLLTNHFPAPSACRIERDGQHYRIIGADHD